MISYYRLCAIIQYDGTPYRGWQTQKYSKAIQDLVEMAFSKIANHKINTICAGRTDAGVHAIGQVIHFDTTARRDLSAWLSGVNTYLPASIVVSDVFYVDDLFHARYSCTSRSYLYALYTTPVKHPIYDNYSVWVGRHLDVEAMNEACSYLKGEHDFTSWRAAGCQAANAIRCISEIQVEQKGIFIYFILTANGFLYHMVRNIIGSMYRIGLGQEKPIWIKYLLEQKNRSLSGNCFLPKGLFFLRAFYENYPHITGSQTHPFLYT